MNKIYAEISAGELVDKITILKIKKEKITNKEKLIEIKKELNSLTNTFNKSIKKNINLETLTKELKNINLKLWDIEDKKRELESIQIDVKTKQKENPYTLYLWNPVTEVKSTKQSGGSKKLVRKHKGIHQIGGKAGKLKKGYKYSGKTLKNGKPQIIKVKRN